MADEVRYKVAEDFKASVSLPSGKEVVIDMMKITTSDWKKITRAGLTDEEEYTILTSVTGLGLDELGTMPQPDYRMLVDAFIRAGTQPLSNPT